MAYRFVSEPPKAGLFRKVSDKYVWVLCDHTGKFLTDTFRVRWSYSFERAAIFTSEREAKKQANEMLKSPSSWEGLTRPYFRVRCVKIL